MSEIINSGDCVRIPDGRIARVRDVSKNGYRVRVKRKKSKYHQFLKFTKGDLTKVQCLRWTINKTINPRYGKSVGPAV